jgi:putative methyltransferase (TIGR04325 family)
MLLTFLNKVKNVYPVKLLRIARYNRKFESDCYSCFRGVYKTFEEAYASAPKDNKIGFNIPEIATSFSERVSKINSYDYPMIFWLQSVLKNNSIVLDFGGNIGVHFYSYQKYILFPNGINWVVCEVQEVAKIGRSLAKKKMEDRLLFIDSIDKVEKFDVLISSGTLQYIEEKNIKKTLQLHKHKPKYLLLNKLPLYDGPEFVTLQNAGCTFVAQHVFNKSNYIKTINDMNYELVDQWTIHDLACYIPFYPNNSFQKYTGMVFKLQSNVGN